MKLDTQRIDGFLQAPSLPVVLIFGPDAGLVAERGLNLARSVPGAIQDPFQFSELHHPDPGGFLNEATASSLTGGRRVLRVREAHEGLLKPLESLLKSPPDCLVILEAGELTAKSKLRAFCEKSAAIAAIACYAIDAARLPQVITARLRGAQIGIDADASAWVANNVGGEEGPLRQAIEILRLYAGEARQLSLADVSAALADGGDSSMHDAIDAALLGDSAGTDRALSLAYGEGVAPIGLLRVLLGELMRLRVSAAAIADGASASQVIAAIRPPVFYKRQNMVIRMLGIWNVPALTGAIRAVLAAESACKQTLTPDQAFCRQTMLALAARARHSGRN